jgi:hypothetical protein
LLLELIDEESISIWRGGSQISACQAVQPVFAAARTDIRASQDFHSNADRGWHFKNLHFGCENDVFACL